MKRTLNRSVSCRGLIATAALAAAFTGTAARAQNGDQPLVSDSAGSESEEITVTALKRNMSAQDTPASVTIVSGEAISDMNISSALDLAAITPGVLIQSAPGALPVVAIRGIGSNASNQSFDQSVALFVDGVFQARGRDYVASLFDVGNIQVIKGSQSAVLGKNTTIGAIALATRRPEFKFGFNASYSHEFALGDDTYDAAVNIPLSDTFAIRAAAALVNRARPVGVQRDAETVDADAVDVAGLDHPDPAALAVAAARARVEIARAAPVTVARNQHTAAQLPTDHSTSTLCG